MQSCQCLVQRSRLVGCPRIPIEDEPLTRWKRLEALPHEPVDKLIIDEVSVFHEITELPAGRRLTGCLLAQGPPGIDVSQTETLRHPGRLGSLTRSGRPQQNQLHR